MADEYSEQQFYLDRDIHHLALLLWLGAVSIAAISSSGAGAATERHCSLAQQFGMLFRHWNWRCAWLPRCSPSLPDRFASRCGGYHGAGDLAIQSECCLRPQAASTLKE